MHEHWRAKICSFGRSVEGCVYLRSEKSAGSIPSRSTTLGFTRRLKPNPPNYESSKAAAVVVGATTAADHQFGRSARYSSGSLMVWTQICGLFRPHSSGRAFDSTSLATDPECQCACCSSMMSSTGIDVQEGTPQVSRSLSIPFLFLEC